MDSAGKKKILIIDDDVAVVDMLKMHLVNKGYDVVTAHDGREGLKQLRKGTPDLITLDMEMPHVDGLDFYKEISDERSRSKFPVLVVTGRAEFRDMFRQMEVEGFISKPFELSYFLREVERIMRGDSHKACVFLMDSVLSPQAGEISRHLEMEHYLVVPAANLNDMKQMAAMARPDFVVMEYMQADMDGARCVSETRKFLKEFPGAPNPALGGIPIIVYSYSGFDFRDKCLLAGADKYLGKPENYGDIVTALREIEMGGIRP